MVRYFNEYHSEGLILRISPLVISKDGVAFAGTIYFDISPILLYLIRSDSNVPSIENITDESRADRK